MTKVNFSKKEIISLIITTAALAFILSFKKWGTDTFDVGEGIANVILMAIIVMFSLYVKLSAQKYAGYKAGFNAEFTHWRLGLIIGLVFAFISNGDIPFLALGVITYSLIQNVRYGYKYNLNLGTMALIAFVGIISFIGLASVFKFLYSVTDSAFFLTGMQTNLLFAFFAILPLPAFEALKKVHDTEGLIILYRAPIGYVGTVALTLISILGLLKLSIFAGIGLAIMCSFLLMAIYTIFYGQK